MRYSLDSNVSNDALAQASRKLGEQIAEARGETYDQDRHLSEGFAELQRRVKERMLAVEVDVLSEVIGESLDLAAE